MPFDNCHACGEKVKTESATFCSLSCSTAHGNRARREEREKDYMSSPSRCTKCDEVLAYPKRNNKYCSRSCSVSMNNLGKRKVRDCEVCGSELKPTSRKYCSPECLSKRNLSEHIDKFNNGVLRNRPTIRKVLTHIRGYECDVCRLSEWMGKPITLQVDHINGNASDDSPENLRLICPNCHSQTNTFGGRNYGNGRGSLGILL